MIAFISIKYWDLSSSKFNTVTLGSFVVAFRFTKFILRNKYLAQLFPEQHS